ncbi:probable glycosyltransferase At5g03795 isoform X2 [Cornus florida]|uniref:probable glycosyltransferase At5g03795 isoform X2 n=1 Tax=Cornus florida TaxID=4283 RepID=UPI00289CB522|nr:probable glycosyltransferase At5g03795 isoform X2 [Cornus florida]
MASSIFLYNSLSIRRLSDSFRGLFFMHISLAFITIFMIFFYISSTSKILIQTQHIEHRTPLYIKQSLGSPTNPPLTNLSMKLISFHKPFGAKSSFSDVLKAAEEGGETPPFTRDGGEGAKRRWSTGVRHDQMSLNGEDENEVFHDREMFVENYKRMNRSLKIYVYPHKRDDPFANILLPVNYEPGGNYASESYFKKVLFKSHFITKDPSEAHLFYLPFSIASMRHDKRVGVGGIQNFIRDYIFNISHSYPYWNRTGGADHFYVACHSIGKVAMEKAVEVKINAIQMVCTSNYFIHGYVPHKDASLPQIWPRRGDPPNVAPSKRKKLAFFAGAMNSPVRQYVLKVWRNDSQIFVNNGRLKTPYDRELLRSKFCLHVKGFEVNTARIGDALYYGCVPVILADHYDLPFADILNWKSFSLIVTTADIPLLKKVLQGISSDEYQRLQSNVLKVRTHFQWYVSPVEYDAFYMVMYELWLRRSHVRISF